MAHFTSVLGEFSFRSCINKHMNTLSNLPCPWPIRDDSSPWGMELGIQCYSTQSQSIRDFIEELMESKLDDTGSIPLEFIPPTYIPSYSLIFNKIDKTHWSIKIKEIDEEITRSNFTMNKIIFRDISMDDFENITNNEISKLNKQIPSKCLVTFVLMLELFLKKHKEHYGSLPKLLSFNLLSKNEEKKNIIIDIIKATIENCTIETTSSIVSQESQEEIEESQLPVTTFVRLIIK